MFRCLLAAAWLVAATGLASAETAASIPPKFSIPWGNSAGASYITYPTPQASQIGITNCAASLTDGFPPLTFTPASGGGCPPFGQNFNGILKQITLWSQWQSAGGPIFYDSGFSASIGGYPKQALLSNASTPGCFWQSSVDNNTSDPDAAGANWLALCPGTIAVGQPITGGSSGRVVYDNSGVIGEYTVTGTAGSVVLSTAPTIAGPTITGTVAGGASYTAPTITSPTITGTVAGGATYTSPTLNSATISGATISGTANFTGTFQVASNTMTFPGTAQTIPGLGTPQTWTAAQTFGNGNMKLAGSSSGTTTLAAAAAASGTISFPAVTDTVAMLGTADQTLSGGANVTSFSNSTGSVTVDCGKSPLQYITNNGNYTITAPANDGSCILMITNGASAGTTSFSGFTASSNTGDPLTTTNTNKFFVWIGRVNGVSNYTIRALQ